MSQEQANKFLEEVYQDEVRRQELVSKTTIDEVIDYAQGQGYDFTTVELQQAQKSFYETHDVELDMEALEAVAGGIVVATIVKA